MDSISSTVSLTAVDEQEEELFSAVHPDIIETHILNRLDGPTLASASCASSKLHVLCTQEKLWRDICIATWPSINHTRVCNLISTFPVGYRSFFSDAFPFPDIDSSTVRMMMMMMTEELISAVDIYYKEEIIYSKVLETETKSSWFLCSPFRVDLLDPKDVVRTNIKQRSRDDSWMKHVEENFRLSWILIDPKRKRAVDMSSRRPVSVQRHWLTGDLQVRFATVMAGEFERRRGLSSSTELVDWQVTMTCVSKEGEVVQVREVSMQVEDMEGRSLSGEDSLVILDGVMERGKRRKEGDLKERKVKYEGFLEKQKEWKKNKQNREKACDFACILVGVTVFVAFWSFLLF